MNAFHQVRASKEYRPEGVSSVHRQRKRFAVRRWSVRHARVFDILYARFAQVFLMLHPIWRALGYSRVERPVKWIEKTVKGFLFDCRMCGQCSLSDTGMSCPMNCPKGLRNGPCGGVRADGHCEVEPEMPCVWVEAWNGSQSMNAVERLLKVQPAIDQSLRNTSAWLRVTAQSAELRKTGSSGQ